MTRLMTFVLSAGPYSGQTAASVLKLAGATLEAGHRATIFATADGVSGFVKGQKVAGVFDVGAAAERFLARGARSSSEGLACDSGESPTKTFWIMRRWEACRGL